MARAVMKVIRVVGFCVRVRDIIRVVMMLMWRPGVSPVIIPASVPSKIGIRFSIILEDEIC